MYTMTPTLQQYFVFTLKPQTPEKKRLYTMIPTFQHYYAYTFKTKTPKIIIFV